MPVKPGYKTTEMYGNGIATVIGAAAASGLLNPDLSQSAHIAAGSIPEAVTIIQTIVDSIMQLTGLIVSVVAPIKYGTGRAMAKRGPEKILIKK